jgi:hypothetical protein
MAVSTKARMVSRKAANAKKQMHIPPLDLDEFL